MPQYVWVTKYIFTKGILRFEVVREEGKFVTCKMKGGWMDGLVSFTGKEYHSSEEAAQTQAREMTIQKINSLAAQIEKLKKQLARPTGFKVSDVEPE